jgi:hypothetical protein
MRLWMKRVERWRDTSLTVAEYAREIGCDARIMAAAVSGRLTVRMLRRLKSVPPTKPRGPSGGLARRREAAALSDAEWMARHSAFERQHVGARRLTQRELLKRTLARIASPRP